VDVRVKDFAVEMELGTKGIELEVRSPTTGRHVGDLIVTKTQVIWCEGRTGRANGKKVSFEDFREWINENGGKTARRRPAGHAAREPRARRNGNGA